MQQVIASGRLEGAPEPTAEEEQRLLSIARGELTADEVIAEIAARYG